MKYSEVDEFLNEILCELAEDVSDIEIEFVREAHRILLIKSAMDGVFETALKYILNINSHAEIFVMADSSRLYLNELGIDNAHIVEHIGRYEGDEYEKYIETIKTIEPDVVCYINYMTFRATYINVMEFVSNISHEVKCRTMAFISRENRIIIHKDIGKFYRLLGMVKPILDYNNYIKSSKAYNDAD